MLFIPSFLPLASHRNTFHSNKPFKELLCTDVKLFISVCGHTPNSRQAPKDIHEYMHCPGNAYHCLQDRHGRCVLTTSGD